MAWTDNGYNECIIQFERDCAGYKVKCMMAYGPKYARFGHAMHEAFAKFNELDHDPTVTRLVQHNF